MGSSFYRTGPLQIHLAGNTMDSRIMYRQEHDDGRTELVDISNAVRRFTVNAEAGEVTTATMEVYVGELHVQDAQLVATPSPHPAPIPPRIDEGDPRHPPLDTYRPSRFAKWLVRLLP